MFHIEHEMNQKVIWQRKLTSLRLVWSKHDRRKNFTGVWYYLLGDFLVVAFSTSFVLRFTSLLNPHIRRETLIYLKGLIGGRLCIFFYINCWLFVCFRGRYSDDPPKGCCGLLAWKPGSLRWFIVLIALVGVCCVLVGTALGAMRPAGRDHLTVSLLMIGKNNLHF